MNNPQEGQSEVETMPAPSRDTIKIQRRTLWFTIMFRLAIYTSIISQLVERYSILSDVLMYFCWACLAVCLGLLFAKARIKVLGVGNSDRWYLGFTGLVLYSIFWPNGSHTTAGLIVFCILAVLDICELIIYRKSSGKAQPEGEA